MRRVLLIPAASLALACRTPVYRPPDADATDTADEPTTSTSTSTSTALTPDLPTPPKLDIPYPDLPGPACAERPLHDTCQPSCGYGLGDGIAEVCDIPAPAAPALFHPLLVDCTCADAFEVVLADFDGDGHDDIASVCNFESRVVVWYGGSARPLACPSEHAVGASPTGLAVADFDGDGHPDLLTAGGVGFGDHSTLSLLRGRGGREFAPHELVLVPALPPEYVHLFTADLDADGDPDLVAHTHDVAHVLIGDGTGTFTSGQVVTFPDHCRDVHLEDFDDDGRPDLLYACSVSDAVYAHRGDGQGGFFDPGVPLVTSDTSIQAFAVAELDGDPPRDLLLLREDDLAFAIGGLDHTFGPLQPAGPAFVGQQIAAVDLDNDGALDVIIHGTDYYNIFGARTRFLTGSVKNGFHLAAYLAHHEELPQFDLGDVNGDGRPDLVFGHYISASNNGGVYLLESAP